MQPRQDDPSISDDEVLWRRVRPEWLHQKDDGTWRPASAAFRDDLSGEVSVHIAALTTQEKVLARRSEDSLVAIKAGFIREQGYLLVRDPDGADEHDPSHVLICPPSDKTNKRIVKDARLMAEAAEWVVRHDPPK